MPCPRAPTSRNPFVCRWPTTCTPTQAPTWVRAHNSQHRNTSCWPRERAAWAALLPHIAWCKNSLHERDCSCEPAVQQAQQRLVCQHCGQHAATALPRLPCHTPSCCALLYRGCALLTRPVQDAPRSQHPPGPPGRLRLHCVCVCVLGDVMFPCRLMCFLLCVWLRAVLVRRASVEGCVADIARSIASTMAACAGILCAHPGIHVAPLV